MKAFLHIPFVQFVIMSLLALALGAYGSFLAHSVLPFLIMLGAVLTAFGLGMIISTWRANHPK